MEGRCEGDSMWKGDVRVTVCGRGDVRGDSVWKGDRTGGVPR